MVCLSTEAAVTTFVSTLVVVGVLWELRYAQKDFFRSATSISPTIVLTRANLPGYTTFQVVG